MERISGTLLIGTQMFSQLQQRQCIAEATAKEQQCLVDYFAQLRPKRWQEWEHKYSGLSTAQYIFLIMQDDLHFDDEAIATALNVKRTSVRIYRIAYFLEIPPTTSSFSMLCSAFLTFALRDPKRQVIERLNERALFQDCWKSR